MFAVYLRLLETSRDNVGYKIGQLCVFTVFFPPRAKWLLEKLCLYTWMRYFDTIALHDAFAYREILSFENMTPPLVNVTLFWLASV